MAKTKALKPLPILECYPRMPAIEQGDFDLDIKENGLLEKMIFWKSPQGTPCLVEGRERQDALQRLDIELDLELHYEEYRGDSPIQFVISRQHKRHLDTGQRSGSAALVLANLPRDQKSKYGKFAIPDKSKDGKKEDTRRAIVARLHGVSPRSVQDAITALNYDKDPELFKKVMSGQMAVSKAADRVRKALKAANPTEDEPPVEVSEQETTLRNAAKEIHEKFSAVLQNLNQIQKVRSRDNLQTVIAALRAFSALQPTLEGIIPQSLVVADELESILPPEEFTEEQIAGKANMIHKRLKYLVTQGHFTRPEKGKDGKVRYRLEHVEQIRAADQQAKEMDAKNQELWRKHEQEQKEKKETEKAAAAAKKKQEKEEAAAKKKAGKEAAAAKKKQEKEAAAATKKPEAAADAIAGGNDTPTIGNTPENDAATPNGPDSTMANLPSNKSPEDRTPPAAVPIDEPLMTTEDAAQQVSELVNESVLAEDLLLMISWELIPNPKHTEDADAKHFGFRWTMDEVLGAAEKWPEHKEKRTTSKNEPNRLTTKQLMSQLGEKVVNLQRHPVAPTTTK